MKKNDDYGLKKKSEKSKEVLLKVEGREMRVRFVGVSIKS